MAKQNEYYDHVIPLRLTEKQAHDLRSAAKVDGVTVNTLVRSELTRSLVIDPGPEPKARKGCGKGRA